MKETLMIFAFLLSLNSVAADSSKKDTKKIQKDWASGLRSKMGENYKGFGRI